MRPMLAAGSNSIVIAFLRFCNSLDDVETSLQRSSGTNSERKLCSSPTESLNDVSAPLRQGIDNARYSTALLWGAHSGDGPHSFANPRLRIIEPSKTCRSGRALPELRRCNHRCLDIYGVGFDLICSAPAMLESLPQQRAPQQRGRRMRYQGISGIFR